MKKHGETREAYFLRLRREGAERARARHGARPQDTPPSARPGTSAAGLFKVTNSSGVTVTTDGGSGVA